MAHPWVELCLLIWIDILCMFWLWVRGRTTKKKNCQDTNCARSCPCIEKKPWSDLYKNLHEARYSRCNCVQIFVTLKVWGNRSTIFCCFLLVSIVLKTFLHCQANMCFLVFDRWFDVSGYGIGLVTQWLLVRALAAALSSSNFEQVVPLSPSGITWYCWQKLGRIQAHHTMH